MSHLGHKRVSFSQEMLPRVSSPQPKLRIKSDFGTRFGDGDYAIVVSDIVDAGSPAREREARGLRRGIDVQAWLARGIFVPRAWSIEEAVAQDDGIETRRAERLVFHIGGAFDRNRPLRIRRIERIRLGMRLAAACIAKRDALHDKAPRGGGRRRRDEAARAFAANACIARV